MAMKTLIDWMTPGASSSPFFRLSTFSLKMDRRASIWRLTFLSRSLISRSRSSSSLSLSFMASSKSRVSRTFSVSLVPFSRVWPPTFWVFSTTEPLSRARTFSHFSVLHDDDLVVEVALERRDLVLLDGLGPGPLLDAPAGEDADVDDGPLDAGRAVEGGVLDVEGLLAEDRLEELLLGRQLGLPLRGDLADQDVARLDVGADADDAVLVEVAEQVLGDVGDVAGDLLGAELGVAGLDRLLDDVEGGEDVLLDELLADDDGVLEVVAPPGHEGARGRCGRGPARRRPCRSCRPGPGPGRPCRPCGRWAGGWSRCSGWSGGT